MSWYDEEEEEREREEEEREVQTVTVYPPAPCWLCGRPECGYACFRCGRPVCYNQQNYFGESTCGGWILDTWHPSHPHENEFYCNVCLYAGLIPEAGLVVAGIPIKAEAGTIHITVGGHVHTLDEEDAARLVAYLWSERGHLFGKPYEELEEVVPEISDQDGVLRAHLDDLEALEEIEDHPF